MFFRSSSEQHLHALVFQVTCAVCDFEELLVKAWDPETLQLPSSQTDQATGVFGPFLVNTNRYVLWIKKYS